MRLRDGLLCSSEIYLSGQRNKGPIMKRVVDFDVAVLSGQITKLSGQESTASDILNMCNFEKILTVWEANGNLRFKNQLMALFSTSSL